MRLLIHEVRAAIPFDDPAAQACPELCQGCTPKLLELLDSELRDWERRLGGGDAPTFGDLDRLAKMSRKIYRVLQQNGVVAPAPGE